MTLKAFLAGCWWSHGHTTKERHGRKLVLVCERCSEAIAVKQSKPRYRRLKDAPKASAKMSNVATFTRESQR